MFFIGQGWLVIGPLLHGSLIKRKSTVSYSQELSLILISGLIINFGLVLIFQTLSISLLVSSVLALIGLICYSVMFFRDNKQQKFTWNSVGKIFGVGLICALFIGPVMFQPLNSFDWDARSIWFLHAKMVYYAGSFSQSSGWTHPSIYFSHADYPKLVPTLAAQITFICGLWNEYLPKVSLYFLIIPAIILIFSFYKRSFSFLFLIILIPFSFSSKLWNGYMDGHLTFYFALSLLFLVRYYKDAKPIDLFTSALSLLLLVYLKNEGVLGLLAGGSAICITLVLKKIKISIRSVLKNYWRYFALLLLILLPYAIWSFYKQQWGLKNDLGIGSTSSLQQFINRMQDGSFKVIINYIHDHMNNGLMLFGLLLIGSFSLRKKIPIEIVPVLFAGIVYCLGIFTIYMITPWDLSWHLRTSVDRTILTVSVCFFIASYILVENYEKNSWLINKRLLVIAKRQY
jgi:hypothetical protein